MPIVSFDFDGVFHNDVIKGRTNYPIESNINIDELQKHINFRTIRNVVKESRDNTVIILTSRGKEDKESIRSFLQEIGINRCIKKVYCTDGLPKSQIINKYNIIRHYDDSKSSLKNIKENSSCQLYRVYPHKNGIIKKY